MRLDVSNSLYAYTLLTVLTLKGPRGSMYDLYTQFLQDSASLKFMFYDIQGFQAFISTLSYVKEKIAIYSYVTLMIKKLSTY
jgi:hypothetical protein